MSDSFALSLGRARESNGPAWDVMSPAQRNAAIFHQMCRADSNCRRTGTAADRDLPPCPASDAFIARRACRLAGRDGHSGK